MYKKICGFLLFVLVLSTVMPALVRRQPSH